MTNRPTAGDRLTRLLAVIPWAAAHPGSTIDELADRFSYRPDQLLSDLTDIVHYVGVPPYTPDTMIEVAIKRDRVWINYADYFNRPLRLTPEEGFALLAAGRALLESDTSATDDDDSSPLLRALTKLGSALGASSQSLDIRLGTADDAVLARLRDAVAERQAVHIDYYSYSRDRRTERVIEPDRVFSDDGQWYVSGHCRLAGAARVFRLDRIARAETLDEHFEPRPPSGGLPLADPDVALPEVVIDIAPEAGWVEAYYPHRGAHDTDEGWRRVRLPVSAPEWLERLLVRLGPHARIVVAPPGLGDARRAEPAARILARYR